MDEDMDEISRRLFTFTLEIISLLSGEDYTIVRKTPGDFVTSITFLQESGGRSPITAPPPHSLIHERSKKRILELSNKMIGLLSGEVPIRCQDVAVYLSMEEWEYLEGHKDRYEEVMMEEHRPVTPRDGSRSRNPPERCPRPLYPQHCPEESHSVLERCPRPLYPQDCPEESHSVPESHQGEDLIDIKVEVIHGAEEAITIWADSQGNPCENNGLSLQCQNDIRKLSNGENLITLHSHPGLHRTSCSDNPPNHEESLPEQSRIVTTIPDDKVDTRFQCDKQLTKISDVLRKVKHEVDKPYFCSECGKSFTNKSYLVIHERIHTGEKPFTCAECGKSFTYKSVLSRHKRIHTGEKPYSCSECGMCFTHKTQLVKHQIIHTGVKPYTCSICEKGFTDQSTLVKHKRIHTGEKPYSCSECGMCFTQKSQLVKHQIIHTGEKPYSCSECGMCFTQKSQLVKHQIIHTGVKPYICSICEKGFTDQSSLVKHKRIHTGEKPYSCSECGKCFTNNSSLQSHVKTHTGEKPYSCEDYGKSVTTIVNLPKHKRTHKREKL